MNELSESEIKTLEKTSKNIRINIIQMIHEAQSGHPGGSLSCVDILNVLYSKVMQHFPEGKLNPNFEKRDRFILAKGHASATLYAILAECGYFDKKELLTFRKLGSKLQGHPCSSELPCIEVSTGSLGQGLSISCGIALGLKLDKIDSSVFVLIGDGELEEGSVWEGIMSAAHHNLDNLIAIIDRNKLQIDGSTELIKSIGNISAKLEAFGWNTIEIDGHNYNEIYTALQKAKLSKKPFAIIANTIKGKGVSFMENNAGWHGKAPNDEQYEAAIKELT